MNQPVIPSDPQQVPIPAHVPLMINNGFVIYPYMIAPLQIRDEATIRMVDEVVRKDRLIGVFTLKPDAEQEAGASSETTSENAHEALHSQIQEIGSVAMVLRMLKMPDGTIRLIVHGLSRVRLLGSVEDTEHPTGRIEVIEEISVDDTETRALQKTIREGLTRLVEQSNTLSDDLIVAANNVIEPGRLADLVTSNLRLNIIEQQQILEIADVKKRLIRLHEILRRELEISNLGSRIESQVRNSLDKNQRNFLLREQMKAIRRELGEEETGEELDILHHRLAECAMPQYAFETAERELGRLKSMSPSSAEYTVSRTYLDWILALPWSKNTKDAIDLEEAQKILNEDHYGLEKIKERILEYLAVVKLRKAIRGPILCLVGPPGVGKTSLGRSIARSMGRKFARISLGGVRDEAEIRGHRRTYIGSMPGRIIKALRDTETNNPVMMLDEIDKIGSDFRGDPASALLEVLDSEQNSTFSDHYLDMPFDLSNVMFVTTANTLEPIPPALLDRMEILELSGYTIKEKLQIAKQYLLPRAIDNAGLKSRQIGFKPDAIEYIIERYTREAGLRNLEREIANLCRKAARKFAEGNKTKITIDRKLVEDQLGPEKFDRDMIADRIHEPGVVVGLAWTPNGGDVLFIEATSTMGKGGLLLTGHLGEVMKESAQAARTWLFANATRLGIDETLFSERELHIHVPSGGIPKDGPSAGITILTAMASLMRGAPIHRHLAMTGEITIKGAVLPIGGVKEKLMAAYRSGVTEIILPKRNMKDLVDVPEEVCTALKIHPVSTADEVLEFAFAPEPEVKAPQKRVAAKPKAPAKKPKKIKG